MSECHGCEAIRREIKEHLDQRLADMDARIATDLRAREQALLLAERNLGTRLEHLNEFRAQIMSERSMFVSREVFDAKVNDLGTRSDRVASVSDDRLRALERAVTDHAVRFWAVGTGATFVAIVVGILLRVWGK